MRLLSVYPVLAAFIILAVSGCTGSVAPGKGAEKPGGYSALERAVLVETNRLRKDPVAYTSVLESMSRRMKGDVYYQEGSNVGIITNEGKGAVTEAIGVMKRQSPLSSLKWSEELAKLAREHVKDTGQKGLLGHESSRGKSFSDRVGAVADRLRFDYTAENISYGPDDGQEVVAQLFIDDGVPSRGHRKNMLTKKLKYAGVGCGYHRQFRTMCVIIYANGP